MNTTSGNSNRILFEDIIIARVCDPRFSFYGEVTIVIFDIAGEDLQSVIAGADLQSGVFGRIKKSKTELVLTIY